MNTLLKLFFLMVLSCSLHYSWAAPYQRFSKDTLSILDAKLYGVLSVSIRGAYNPNKIQPDLTSAHYGECIDIKMKNMSDSVINVVLKCGTMLLSRDSSSQNMVVTKTLFYRLKPKEKITDRVYAMCGQLHKNSPDIYIRYDVGDLADEPLLRLAQIIEKKGEQNKIGQYAVWAVTDGATKDDLGEDFATLAQSQSLLKEAKINMNILGHQAVALNDEMPKSTQPKKTEKQKQTKSQSIIDTETKIYEDVSTLEEEFPMVEEDNNSKDAFSMLPEATEVDNVLPPAQKGEDYILLIASIGVSLFGLYYFWKKKPINYRKDNSNNKLS
ncbi:MAG: hypothetical protein MUE81_00455 [Thermoflexibacter sp.]|jgi:hypothetical protein|nr:hypothetical protein [Thermoflexibacter sp.]